MYITNNPTVAHIAESNGVDRIMVDIETIGKEDRQKNMDTVKSHHQLADVMKLRSVLKTSELMVRINPWYEGSTAEIDAAISNGATRIMLPMWRTVDEVSEFLSAVNQRVYTTLLLETKEAVECLDEVLNLPLIDEIHIGLNDLHLSYGMTFMFELLANGMVDLLCNKCKEKGISYGFGGIAKIGEGTLPAEMIVTEHYRLGSSMTILSRGFCNVEKMKNLEDIKVLFKENVNLLRDYEKNIAKKQENDFVVNHQNVVKCVSEIVDEIRGRDRV